MMVVKTILLILLFIVLAILVLLLLLLIIPFKYKLVIIDKNDERYELRFNYLIVKLEASISFNPKFVAKVKLFDRIIVDTSVKKEKNKKESIEDTGFIKNKSLSRELESGKKEVKNLFLSARKFEKSIQKKENTQLTKVEKDTKVRSANSIIDKFKSVFPSDFIYAVKKIVAEGIYAFSVIKPTKCSFNIKLDDDDPFRNGIIMTFAAPLYAVLGDKVKISQHSKSGTKYMATFIGRPILIRLIGPIVRLLLDKKVRKLIFKKKK